MVNQLRIATGLVLVLVTFSIIHQSADAITIDMVAVGNPGNAPDTRYDATGFGSVAYAYQIGKYEVTAGQYTAFLNAVAKADPNNLYNLSMGSIPNSGANIQRTGSPSNFSYSVATDWANRPVNYVSFWDAARFANWLHNGQPTGAQGPGTTEGGAYVNIGNELTFARQPGAKFFIPSENEWYKAAYHKNDGVSGNYWDYPTASDTAPINTLPDPGNHANFYDFFGTGNNGATIGGPYNRTEVGAFTNSASPYGTFDQGGNLGEWSETAIDSSRRVRGGGYFHSSVELSASFRDFLGQSFEGDSFGFRVASIAIPEPSTLLLLCIGSLAVLRRRRSLVCASILAAFVCAATSAQAVTIEMVTVGNPGNAAGSYYGQHSWGAVDRVYQIGKYEVTAGQYTEFLNAVAKADPNALYNPAMGDPVGAWGANIQRSGSSPIYSYSVAADWANRPVNWVSFWDAARFANWLHNGQPTGAQGPGTTEDGAYHDIGNQALFGRNPGAIFFIPTEDEWFKAAYHDKAAGLVANYSEYPTGSYGPPGPGTDITEATNPGNNANHRDGFDAFAIGSPYYRTVAGEFELSASRYGTFDQGGNVSEWVETLFDGSRGLRGGSFVDQWPALAADSRAILGPSYEDGLFVGFRVASIPVPEPSTLLLLCFGSLAMLWRTRGLVCAAILAAAFATTTNRAAADTFGSGANTFDIRFVTIGNPGNAPDTTGKPNPAGAVPYTYRMGKFEISEQMIDKANAEGNLGITKDTRGADKPATRMSWNEAARFVNWLNTTSGGTPAYKFAIEPGEVGYVANVNIELWTTGDAGYNPNNLYRNSLARYFLPSADEWYKAAYYDPTSGVYYNNPTGSDITPDGIDFANGPNFDAVFNDGYDQGGPNDITNVGVLSPYGTAGQGGNVREFEETDYLDLVNGPTFSSDERGLRGGYWDDNSGILLSSIRSFTTPLGKNFLGAFGFRVASNIPEPSTLLLLCFGSLAVLWRRRFVCASILAVVVSMSLAGSASADTFGSGANTFDIEFVTIGNPGNAADMDDGSIFQSGIQNFGSVSHTYRMGKFEISEQMIDKANEAGGLGLTKETNGPDKAAYGISWNEAARFVNWG